MNDSDPPKMADEAWMLEIQAALEELAVAQTCIQLVQEVGKQTSQLEQWTVLMLQQLQVVHSGSGCIMRRIIIDMVQAKVISKHLAADVSGFSRTSIYNWLKEDADQA